MEDVLGGFRALYGSCLEREMIPPIHLVGRVGVTISFEAFNQYQFGGISIPNRPFCAFGTHILVAGGSDFLGSHLCERLLARGAEVICLDNLFTGTRNAHFRESKCSCVFHSDATIQPADTPIKPPAMISLRK